MTKTMIIEQIGDLDTIAECVGGYVDFCPDPYEIFGIDITALGQYCQEHGKSQMDLTTRERNMFIMKFAETSTVLSPLQNVLYDYHAISRYGKEKGISPVDLTLRELQQFTTV